MFETKGDKMPSTGSAIIILLAFAWLLQFGLSFFQMRRFYRRIAVLHKYGSVWIGMEGTAWKRRQYAVLVVDKENIIRRAEELSGWTILATLKPVAGLDGRPISDLKDDTIDLPVKGKLLLAFRNAVKLIEEHSARKAARENESTDEHIEMREDQGMIQRSNILEI
jgi:DNA-binding transcriptional regulator of glucitol operon